MRLHPQLKNYPVSPELLARPAPEFPSAFPSQGAAPEKWAAALRSPVYVEVGRRVFRQLIEAFIFEGIGKTETRPAADGEMEYTLHGQDVNGHPVYYLCMGRVALGFGRIRLSAMAVQRVSGGDSREAGSMADFLMEVLSAAQPDQERLLDFVQEIQQTLIKDVMAHFQRPLTDGSGTLTHDALEGEVLEGHRYHPCYKSRIGFDLGDNDAYGPEFQRPFKLTWIGVSTALASVYLARSVDYTDFVRRELGETLYARFLKKIQDQGRDPADYVFVPVHPWQLRKKILFEYFAQIHDDRIIVLGEGDDEYRAQQSIRTLSNISFSGKTDVKLPLSIINTSADRILSYHHVENGPRVSDWLADIVAGDGYLRNRLVILREVAGVSCREDGLMPAMQARRYGLLGAVWRENPSAFLSPGEAAIPFTALCHRRADGQAFIDAWIRQMGLKPWLGQLLDVVIQPLVYLLYSQGIGMEAHAQNLMLIHRNGRPVRIAIKDLPGGMRFVRPYLSNPQRCPPLQAAPAFRDRMHFQSGMEVAAPAEVRDFFHDAFFFINLSELSFLLHEKYGLEERVFWSMAAQSIKSCQAWFPALRPRFALFDLFADTVKVEALAKRRLFSETEHRVHAVPNPLRLFR